MADRTSAEIYSNIFTRLAKKKITKGVKAEALEFWNESMGYDFSHCQMDADEALVKLGLATECSKCSYVMYKGDEDDHSEDECEEIREN
jgi:hypothetical protein